ncbi:MAG: hypothetical protein RL213_571 [Bacteroidota bacterium]|jgi:hypothetical protein
MDYRRFNDLVASKGSEKPSALASLQEFVRNHPYCQTGHLLLTRSMFLQDHSMYERQLNRTAAAVPDRTVLFNLIHGAKETVHSPTFRTEPHSSPFSTEEAVYPLQAEPAVQEHSESPFAQQWNLAGIPLQERIPAPLAPSSRVKYHPALDEEVPATVSAAYELMGDRHDIIRRKLEEMLVQPVDVKASGGSSSPSDAQSLSGADKSSEEKQGKDVFMLSEPLSGTASEDEERLFREMELGHALEESFLRDLEKLPVLEAPATEEASEQIEPQKGAESEGKGFFQWLKRNHGRGFGTFEEVDAKEEEPEIPAPASTAETAATPEARPADTIINEFIRTSPRIVPQPKAEFFNPAVQAKRSVEEHDDLVSETLGRIYAEQGNLRKAKWCYERLSLLHPEKKAYFAALIDKIDQQPDNGSEDL